MELFDLVLQQVCVIISIRGIVLLFVQILIIATLQYGSNLGAVVEQKILNFETCLNIHG